MFKRTGNACKFKGKAAECRHLIPIVLEILRIAFPRETEHQKLRFNCVQELANLYKIVMAWDDDVSSQAVDAARRFHIYYAELNKASCAARGDLMVWRFVPKFHLLHHCCESIATFGSIIFHWCYADERSIGRAAKLAAAGHASTISKTVMEKYRCWDVLS